MNEIKYHLILFITPEEKWKLKGLAVRSRKSVKVLMQETVRKLIKEGK